jgi:hypothetical protein
MRRLAGDRLRGEAFFILALTVLALLMLLTHYLSWALIKPLVEQTVTSPAGGLSWGVLYWLGQLGTVLVVGVVGVLGFRPALTVAIVGDDEELRLQQGARAATVPFDAIDAVGFTSARRFHRHYRRYAATRVFRGGLLDEVVLVETTEGPLIIALDDTEDQATLVDQLQRAVRPAVPASDTAQAA